MSRSRDTNIKEAKGSLGARMACVVLCLTRNGRNVSLHPFRLCKVRKLNRRASAAHRSYTERTDGGPGSGVIYIQIRRKPFSHALQQPIEHDEIHAAMSANLCRYLALFLPERMRILLPCINRDIRLIFILPIKVDARRVVLENSFRSGNKVNAIVGVRCRDSVLDRDGESL